MAEETLASLQRPWWRRVMVPLRRACPRNLRGRCIVVTGATPGSLGFATARILATWGADVVVSSRTHTDRLVEALQHRLPAAAGGVCGYPLDLAQASSVDAFADWFRARPDARLDVLINNAGIHLDLLSRWTEPNLSADGQECHWRVNFLGSFHLTQALLPLLLQSAAQTGDARVVNVSSQLHGKGSNPGLFRPPLRYNSWVAYGLSKLALQHMSAELHRRYLAQGLSSTSLHPGAVYSGIADKGLAGADRLLRLRQGLAPLERAFLRNIDEGAQTSVHCAVDPQALAGGYYRNCRPARPAAALADAEVSARVWQAGLDWMAGR